MIVASLILAAYATGWALIALIQEGTPHATTRTRPAGQVPHVRRGAGETLPDLRPAPVGQDRRGGPAVAPARGTLRRCPARPAGAKNTIAPRGGLQPRGGAIMMTSAETTLGVRLPDKRLPLDRAAHSWHDLLATGERDTPEQAVTGGDPAGPDATRHDAHNVPPPRDGSLRRKSRGRALLAFGVGRRADVGTHRVSRVPVRMAQSARRRGGSHRRHPTPYAPFRAPFGGRGDVVESCRHTPPMGTSNTVPGVSATDRPTVDHP